MRQRGEVKKKWDGLREERREEEEANLKRAGKKRTDLMADGDSQA